MYHLPKVRYRGYMNDISYYLKDIYITHGAFGSYLGLYDWILGHQLITHVFCFLINFCENVFHFK